MKSCYCFFIVCLFVATYRNHKSFIKKIKIKIQIFKYDRSTAANKMDFDLYTGNFIHNDTAQTIINLTSSYLPVNEMIMWHSTLSKLLIKS